MRAARKSTNISKTVKCGTARATNATTSIRGRERASDRTGRPSGPGPRAKRPAAARDASSVAAGHAVLGFGIRPPHALASQLGCAGIFVPCPP